MMELNERIKKARKDAGYKSRDALADYLGSTRDAIASYELGRVVPNDVFLQLMAAKLNISYEWLKMGEGEMNAPAARSDEIAAAVRKMFPDESEDFQRQFAKILSSLKEEMWQVLLKKMMEIQEIYAKKDSPKEKAAPEISEADMEAYDRVNAYFDEHPNERIKKEWEKLSACSKDADAG